MTHSVLPQVTPPASGPYAYEYGRDNGDGTYSVVIERSFPRNPHKDKTIKALYAGPVAEQGGMVPAALVQAYLDAVSSDGKPVGGWVPKPGTRQWETRVHEARDKLGAALASAVTATPSAAKTPQPCRSPYCECELGSCSHPGFYDARHMPCEGST